MKMAVVLRLLQWTTVPINTVSYSISPILPEIDSISVRKQYNRNRWLSYVFSVNVVSRFLWLHWFLLILPVLSVFIYRFLYIFWGIFFLYFWANWCHLKASDRKVNNSRTLRTWKWDGTDVATRSGSAKTNNSWRP